MTSREPTAETQRLLGIIFRLYNLMAIGDFERDPGSPPLILDGVKDRVMTEANEALEDYVPCPEVDAGLSDG